MFLFLKKILNLRPMEVFTFPTYFLNSWQAELQAWIYQFLTIVIRCAWYCNCCSSRSSMRSSIGWARCSSSGSNWNYRRTPFKGIATVAFFTVTRGSLICYDTDCILTTYPWARVFTFIAKACLMYRTVRIKNTIGMTP